MSDPLDRLVKWLSDHPADLERVVREIGLRFPRCEGHSHQCNGIVLWETTAMTAYEWDGQGEDPNRPRLLCPACSAEYREDWQERWDEYYASVLP